MTISKIRKLMNIIFCKSARFNYLTYHGYLDNVSDKKYLSKLYEIYFSKKLDLDNPRCYTEKIQWLKLYNREPIYSKMVDKYEVKKIVGEIIGESYIIPTISVYDSFDDIDFNVLPRQFVIKCTHDSGGLVVCKDKNSIDIKKAKEKIERCLLTNYYKLSREWAYLNVRPRIIIEKYIQEIDGDLLDYKVHCFGGIPKFIQVIGERDLLKHTGKQQFYDFNWEILGWTFADYPEFTHEIHKPEKLMELFEVCKKLSNNIPYVRLDFYYIGDVWKFGEMTFYPGGGFYKYQSTWNKQRDIELGSYIVIK